MTDTTTEEIEIPPNVITTCPLYGFVHVGNTCVGDGEGHPSCPHFQGFYGVQRMGTADMPFTRKYRVQCAAPQALEMYEVTR